MKELLLDRTFEEIQINLPKRIMKDLANQAMVVVEQKRKMRDEIVKDVIGELMDDVFNKIENMRKLAEIERSYTQMVITLNGLLLKCMNSVANIQLFIYFIYPCFLCLEEGVYLLTMTIK